MPTEPAVAATFPPAQRPETAGAAGWEGLRRHDEGNGSGAARSAGLAPKDILLLVDDMPSRIERMQLACRLARRFGAHLTALYPLGGSDSPPPAAAQQPAAAERFNEDGRAVAAAIGRLFEDMARREQVSAAWRAEPGNAVAVAIEAALHTDLAVLGQSDPDFTPLLPPQVRPENIVLAAGRPALVVPHSGHFETVGERVLIAWQPTREAARAVNDALPLLRGAADVRIIMVDAPEPPRSADGGAPAAADLTVHLARHGIDATIDYATSSGRRGDVAATILSYAAERGSDLVVIGAYGRPRVQKIVLGDVTDAMLRRMAVPAFMSY